MKTNIVDHTKTVFARNESKTKLKWTALLFFLVFVALSAGGCEGTYTAYPGYGPYYGGYGPYGPGYGPGYAAYPGSVTVEVGGRPYYNRGAGYYVGSSYYVWRPGHLTSSYGRRVRIHSPCVV